MSILNILLILCVIFHVNRCIEQKEEQPNIAKSVKKELKPLPINNNTIAQNITSSKIPESANNPNSVDLSKLPSSFEDNVNENGGLFNMFFVFIVASFSIIGFIIFRSFRMRSSRAERKYGVQGDKEAQELTPLPFAMEDDSDFDDQTLFDINNTKVYGH